MYSSEKIKTITGEYSALMGEYYELAKSITVQGQSLTSDRTKEHLLHGVGRRIFVIRRAVENIFSLFPPDTTRKLSQDALYDVQINLQAFTMNLYGIFENCAWAFVIFHDLETDIGNWSGISLFRRETKRYLPKSLKNYLNTQDMKDWQKYIKSYRDSLAHRIPLYIPPANFTDDDAERYSTLEEERMECFRQFAEENGELALVDRVEQIAVELADIGSPTPVFLHSLTHADATEPIQIHLQMISDSRAIIEFVNLFLREWKTRN